MNNSNNEYEVEQKIAALDVYIQEYIHRDNHMWDLGLKFFFASLTVTLLPTLNSLKIPEFLNRNSFIFPLLGIVLAFIFLYVTLHQLKRFEAISDTYSRIVTSLPDSIKRKSLKDSDNEKCFRNKLEEHIETKVLNPKNSKILFILMFSALIALAVIMMFIYL